MLVLLKIASVRISFIQIMQIRVQNKSKNVWISRYDGDVSSTQVYFPYIDSTKMVLENSSNLQLQLLLLGLEIQEFKTGAL